MKILMLAAEATPFVKVGGLADVVGALPIALQERGHEVRVAIPHYPSIDHESFEARAGKVVPVPWRGGYQASGTANIGYKGVRFDLVGGPPIWGSPFVYTDSANDGEKFVYFAMAALELARADGFQPDVVHVQDAHPGAALYWLKKVGVQSDFWRNTAGVLTIHNLPFQMNHLESALQAANLPPCSASSIPVWARAGLMGLGIYYADMVNTVSPGYAAEIQTEAFGAGLQQLLRARGDRLVGISNGLDEEVWNPATDSALARPFDANALDSRAENKQSLQQALGLTCDPTLPLLGVVSRLDHQKGFDLATDALRTVLSETNAQLALLGNGHPEIMDSLRHLEGQFPNRVSLSFRFDDRLARQIYGGSDIFLLPSRYEPGGLTKMIAMRYGSIPLIRGVGGLWDGMVDARENPSRSTGFVFQEYSADSFAQTIKVALDAYANRLWWRDMQRRAMAINFSWQHAAMQYDRLYQQALQKPFIEV